MYNNIYNTNFEVKYYSIKNELLNKLNNHEKQLKEDKLVDEIDYKYDKDDIDLICRKLYNDELSSVFYSNSIFDDNIDINMRKLFNLFIKKEFFKEFIKNIIIELTNNNINLNNFIVESEEDREIQLFYALFMFLFNEEVFYLTHIFIQKFINNNIIDQNLLVLLKSNTIKSFTYLYNNYYN